VILFCFCLLATLLITTVQIRQPIILMVSTNAGVKNSDQCLQPWWRIRSQGHFFLLSLLEGCVGGEVRSSWTNGFGCGLSLLWNLLFLNHNCTNKTTRNFDGKYKCEGVKNSDQCLQSWWRIRSRGHCLLSRQGGLCGRWGAESSWTNGFGCVFILLWNFLYDSMAISWTKGMFRSLYRVWLETLRNTYRKWKRDTHNHDPTPHKKHKPN
jgi:hypothetical protein